MGPHAKTLHLASSRGSLTSQRDSMMIEGFGKWVRIKIQYHPMPWVLVFIKAIP